MLANGTDWRQIDESLLSLKGIILSSNKDKSDPVLTKPEFTSVLQSTPMYSGQWARQAANARQVPHGHQV